MTAPARNHPPPWLFAFSAMPYGVVGSFAGAVMPYLTSKAGIKLDTIGWFQLLLFLPPMLQFLYAPIVDVGPKRKHWLVIVTVLGAAALVLACTMPLPEQTPLFLVFAVAAQLISGLVGSCNGGLMATTIPDELRGRAGAFYNIGNLSGGAISAAVAIWMVKEKMDPLVIGLTLATMMVLPSLLILSIVEPARDHTREIGEVMGATFKDIRKILATRKGFTGLLLCASPVGTAALANYFSGMQKDFQASDNLVAFLSGPANAVLTATGAFLGGLLCDRYNRRAMYLLSGVLTAMCGIVMAISPATELVYGAGVMVYALITGFCYAAFTASALETIGDGGEAASTQYSMFTAAGNFAIWYVGFVDTRFYENDGVAGVIASDAILNIAGVAILGIVFWRMGSFARGKMRLAPQPTVPAATAREKS